MCKIKMSSQFLKTEYALVHKTNIESVYITRRETETVGWVTRIPSIYDVMARLKKEKGEIVALAVDVSLKDAKTIILDVYDQLSEES